MGHSYYLLRALDNHQLLSYCIIITKNSVNINAHMVSVLQMTEDVMPVSLQVHEKM